MILKESLKGRGWFFKVAKCDLRNGPWTTPLDPPPPLPESNPRRIGFGAKK